MSISNPEKFWNSISKEENWRDYILPREKYEDFDEEGFVESQRLFYFFDNNSTIIDYGCGIGRVAKYTAIRAKRLVGLDVSKDFIEKAKEYTKLKNISFYFMEDYAENNVADFIYSLMVLQHNDFNNRDKIIKHIYDLLKKQGRALINFPRKESDYYQETDFVHKFSREEVEEYGRFFNSYEIIEGNLVNYKDAFNPKINHEYFLIAKK